MLKSKSSISGIAIFCTLLAGNAAQGKIIGNDSWEAELSDNGTLRYYKGSGTEVPFRTDAFAGPKWEGVEMYPCSTDSLSFSGAKDGIEYSLRYIPMADNLAVECRITNATDSVFAPERASLNVGVDSEMQSYPQWNDRFFPTLMRCEPDFSWGYFMSPQGGVIAVGVEDPVASYSLQYIYRDIIEWRWGHRIFTGAWDMLHCLPLPKRHPQHLDRLAPGESRTWTLHLGTVNTPAEVKPQLARWLKAPMIELSAYTIAPGEECSVRVDSPSGVEKIIIENFEDSSDSQPIKIIEDWEGVDLGRLPTIDEPGLYRITAIGSNGKRAEATLHVRRPWGEYLRQARDMVAANPPLVGNSCESFYGYYPAFLAARHYPSESDKALEERIERDVNLLVDTITGQPAEGAKPYRVQNFSTMAGILADLYEATGNERYLTTASRIADYLCSEAVQSVDGAYRARGTHYTAVIYPAKSMLEVAEAEMIHFRATADSLWLSKAERHKASAMAAIADLAERRDNIATEGEMTYEDGMISCSALQLALGAVETDDPEQKARLLEAAEYMIDGHRCLEQNLIPDARMRGATLRYWEALDVYFSPNQVMNSPHGWTGWKIYALYYLYLLTGDEAYMRDMTDTLGAGVQMMEADGHLRWGFLPDPYIRGRVCVPSPEGHGQFEYADTVVGEQYLEMISPWMRPDDEHTLMNFGKIGGAGDHTVYEIFKALEEVALSTAYIRVENGRITASDNCTATFAIDNEKGVSAEGTLTVNALPEVDKVHIFADLPLAVSFSETMPASLRKNQITLAPGPNLLRLSSF